MASALLSKKFRNTDPVCLSNCSGALVLRSHFRDKKAPVFRPKPHLGFKRNTGYVLGPGSYRYLSVTIAVMPMTTAVVVIVVAVVLHLKDTEESVTLTVRPGSEIQVRRDT